MKHTECKICPYYFEGQCKVGVWLDPFERVPRGRDINVCLDEWYEHNEIWKGYLDIEFDDGLMPSAPWEDIIDDGIF